MFNPITKIVNHIYETEKARRENCAALADQIIEREQQNFHTVMNYLSANGLLKDGVS